MTREPLLSIWTGAVLFSLHFSEQKLQTSFLSAKIRQVKRERSGCNINRKQLSAVRRVLKREKKNCKKDDLLQRPGLHPSMGRHLVTDGHIAILLDSPLKYVPVGSCEDSLAGMIYRECNRGEHFPLDDIEVNPELWTRLQSDDYDLGSVELAVSTDDGHVIRGEFSPMCLLDAWEAVGEDACFYMGYGGMDRRRLTVLVAPPEGSRSNGALIARVLELCG